MSWSNCFSTLPQQIRSRRLKNGEQQIFAIARNERIYRDGFHCAACTCSLSSFVPTFGLCCKDCMHKYFDMNFFVVVSFVEFVATFVHFGICSRLICIVRDERFGRICNDGNIENCLRNHYHHNIQYHGAVELVWWDDGHWMNRLNSAYFIWFMYYEQTILFSITGFAPRSGGLGEQ